MDRHHTVHLIWMVMMMMTDPVQCSPVLAPKKADLSQPSRVDGSWVLLNKMSMNDDDDLSVMMMI